LRSQVEQDKLMAMLLEQEEEEKLQQFQTA
jgi:hypothetical protein